MHSSNDANVTATNIETNVSTPSKTNGVGIYIIPGLRPGPYRVTVSKDGFQTTTLSGLVLNVQDIFNRNFELQVGARSETVTVVAETTVIDTTDGTVSTVVDHQFAENLPMNGRSFQSLIELTPGVVLAPPTGADPGQFSVNGQRTSANYFTVDGVSANIAVSAFAQPGQTASGSIGSVDVLGGTNNLVSEDALQEFRIQTSTFAPEFGRTPGAQVSNAKIVIQSLREAADSARPAFVFLRLQRPQAFGTTGLTAGGSYGASVLCTAGRSAGCRSGGSC